MVDDAIQSGEIHLPRSMVIRSQSQPVMEAQPEPPPETPPPPKPARRLRVLWLLAALVPAGAAVGLGFIKPPAPVAPQPVHTLEADSVAQLVGTTLDGEARAVLVRAEAIASSSMLRAGIQTDAKTLADMAKDKDIVFPHGPGETIEVLQLAADGRKSLLRIPSGAAAVTPPPAGTARIEQRGDQVVVVADAAVTSSSNEIGGEIAISAPIDLSPIQKRPYEQLTGVFLTGFTTAVPLGGGKAVPNGAPVTAKIVTTTATSPPLVVAGMVAVPPPETQSQDLVKAARLACAGLALLLLVIFGISLRR